MLCFSAKYHSQFSHKMVGYSKIWTKDLLHPWQESYPVQQREGQVEDSCTVFVCLIGSFRGHRARLFSERYREKMRSNRNNLQKRKFDNIVHNIQDQSLKQVVQRGCVISSLEDMPNLTVWGLKLLDPALGLALLGKDCWIKWHTDLNYSAMLTPSSFLCLTNQGLGCSQLPCVWEGIWELIPDSKDRWLWTCQRCL